MSFGASTLHSCSEMLPNLLLCIGSQNYFLKQRLLAFTSYHSLFWLHTTHSSVIRNRYRICSHPRRTSILYYRIGYSAACVPKFNHPTWSHAASAIVLQPRARDRLRAVLILAIYVWSIPPRGRKGRGEMGKQWTARSGRSGIVEGAVSQSCKIFGRETMFHLNLLKFQHQSFKSFTVNFQYTKQVFVVSEQIKDITVLCMVNNRSKIV